MAESTEQLSEGDRADQALGRSSASLDIRTEWTGTELGQTMLATSGDFFWSGCDGARRIDGRIEWIVDWTVS